LVLIRQYVRTRRNVLFHKIGAPLRSLHQLHFTRLQGVKCPKQSNHISLVVSILWLLEWRYFVHTLSFYSPITGWAILWLVCFERIAFVLDASIRIANVLIFAARRGVFTFWVTRIIHDYMREWLECASSVNYNSSLERVSARECKTRWVCPGNFSCKGWPGGTSHFDFFSA